MTNNTTLHRGRAGVFRPGLSHRAITDFQATSRGRVSGFNNLWMVELKPVSVGGALTCQGRLLTHVLLDIDVGVSLIHRDYGVPAGRGSRDDE